MLAHFDSNGLIGVLLIVAGIVVIWRLTRPPKTLVSLTMEETKK